MDALSYEGLGLDEKLYLGSLTKHPGWLVFLKLLENACLQATTKVIKLKRDNPDYDRLVKIYQTDASLINELCAAIIKSVTMHEMSGEMLEEQRKLEEGVEAAGVDRSVVSSVFGSARIKPPRV